MPEELFAIHPWRDGGKGDVSRRDIRMAITAIRKQYGLTQEQRQKMVDRAEMIMDNSADERTRLGAIKMLTEMDKIDAKREETAVQQKHHEVLEATAMIRAAMSGADVREQLADLSDAICTPLPIEVQKEIDGIHIDAATDVVHSLKDIGGTSNGHTNGKP